MVLEIIHLIILTATLACGLVVAWYAQKIHAAQARELSFLDARDIDQRRHRAEVRHAGQAWNKELHNWHRDTRAILGKLYAIAAETSAEERDTRLLPPPPPPPSLAPAASAPETSPRPGVAPISRQRPSPGASEVTRAEARFPGTMLSMPSPAPSSPRASRASRPMAPVETKSICRGCDGGFIAVGNGGIGKCHDCDGSGFIDAR